MAAYKPTKPRARTAAMAVEDPTQHTKRLKVLTAKKLSKSLQAIYDQNAKASPLLRCPPEVRNRIWYFALGGKTIHIPCPLYSRPGSRYAICRAKTDDEDQHVGTNDDAIQCYTGRHSDCIYSDGPVKPDTRYLIPFELLRVCRQIHRETALLPFSSNTFAFTSLESLWPFLMRPILAQTRAIQKVHIMHNMVSDHKPYRPAQFTKLLNAKSTGLKELEVDIEAFTNSHKTFDEVGWNTLRANLLQFRHLPAVSTKVTLTVVKGRDSRFRLLAPSQELATMLERSRKWAEDVEEEIMRPAV